MRIEPDVPEVNLIGSLVTVLYTYSAVFVINAQSWKDGKRTELYEHSCIVLCIEPFVVPAL